MMQTRSYLRALLQELNPEYRLTFDRDKLEELEKSYPELIFTADRHSALIEVVGASLPAMPETSQAEKMAKEAARLDYMKGQVIERTNWANVEIVEQAIKDLRASVAEFQKAGLSAEVK